MVMWNGSNVVFVCVEKDSVLGLFRGINFVSVWWLIV